MNGRGVNLDNLCQLRHTSKLDSMDLTLHMALINARSITNKSFVLNYFFIYRDLDFMLLTETWLHISESTAFFELLPPDCSFFSSPWTTGKGGGVATVFKSHLSSVDSR